jgi:glycosyltransferase involved in cell wall biosynthesis
MTLASDIANGAQRQSLREPLISVIVPVYNVEAYLERCIDSIIAQTYENLELVLVDDGSTDASGSICDSYVQRDARIRVLHTANGGISAARNAGIAVAKGDLIGFVDSDDWIEPDMYACLLGLMRENDCDAAQIELWETAFPGTPFKQKPERVDVYTGEDILVHFLEHNRYSACMRLHVRRHFDGFAFDVGHMNEDVVGGFELLSRAERFAVSNQVKYHYFQNLSGVTNSPLRERDFDLMYSGQRLNELTEGTSCPRLRRLALTKQRRAPFTLLIKMALYGASPELGEKQTVSRLRKQLRPHYCFLMASEMPLNRKLLLTLVCVSYKLTKLLARAFRSAA